MIFWINWNEKYDLKVVTTNVNVEGMRHGDIVFNSASISGVERMWVVLSKPMPKANKTTRVDRKLIGNIACHQ